MENTYLSVKKCLKTANIFWWPPNCPLNYGNDHWWRVLVDLIGLKALFNDILLMQRWCSLELTISFVPCNFILFNIVDIMTVIRAMVLSQCLQRIQQIPVLDTFMIIIIMIQQRNSLKNLFVIQRKILISHIILIMPIAPVIILMIMIIISMRIFHALTYSVKITIIMMDMKIMIMYLKVMRHQCQALTEENILMLQIHFQGKSQSKGVCPHQVKTSQILYEKWILFARISIQELCFKSLVGFKFNSIEYFYSDFGGEIPMNHLDSSLSQSEIIKFEQLLL